MLQTLIDLQGAIREAVNGLFGRFAETGDLRSLFVILPLGMAFGAIHALTPGHSKIVLASYLVGSRLPLKRSTLLAAALAFTHILSAVALALLAAPLISRTIGGVGRAPSLELFSRGFLAIIGVWLIVRALRHRPHVAGEGMVVGFAAGLIPCPLTLFAMVLALAKGVPLAGLTFAFAMLFGVGFTLTVVAVATVVARERSLALFSRHGASIERISRLLDFASGLLLLTIGAVAVMGG